jgi:hypothetical protein
MSLSSFYFEVRTRDGVDMVCVTPMSQTCNSVEFDVWCPENPMYNTRLKCDRYAQYQNIVKRHIEDTLKSKEIKGALKLINTTSGNAVVSNFLSDKT